MCGVPKVVLFMTFKFDIWRNTELLQSHEMLDSTILS